MAQRSPGLDAAATTRYGATADGVERSAGVLRARAARAGLELRPASEVDLAAAVVGVESWMAVLRTESLETPIQHGRPAVQALAASMARAAGHGSPVVPVEAAATSDDLLQLVAGHARWAVALLGAEGAGEALCRAASDVTAGAEHPAFSALAAALSATAEDLSLLQ